MDNLLAEQQHTLNTLLGLFYQLNLAGVTGHEYVDYLFEKYGLKRLSDLTQEQLAQQVVILQGLALNNKTREQFRGKLLGFVPKTMRYI